MVPYRRVRPVRAAAGDGCTLAIGDLHAPFMHRDAVEFLSRVNERLKPTAIVSLGDEADFHAISRWPADPDGHSAGHELDRAIEQLRPLYRLFPTVRVCISNHTIRPYKRAFEARIPKRVLRPYQEMLDAPAGWAWDDRWIVDDVVYEHGEDRGGVNGHRSAMLYNMATTVIGHIHASGGNIDRIWTHERQLCAMNAGCLIDAKAYAMAYGKRGPRPVLGVGIVERGDTRFVAMHLTPKGSWNGSLIGL